jgi:hypothetical protein
MVISEIIDAIRDNKLFASHHIPSRHNRRIVANRFDEMAVNFSLARRRVDHGAMVAIAIERMSGINDKARHAGLHVRTAIGKRKKEQEEEEEGKK